MKKLASLIMALSILLTTKAFAQEFTGLATYKTAMKMNIALDSSRVSADEQSRIQQQLMKAMQREYTLTFNASESNWKEIEKLEKETGDAGVRVMMVGVGGGADGLLYKNTAKKNFLETADAFGKLFLVSGPLEVYEWEMTDETKQIGQYTCYKATTEREITEMRISEVDGETEEKEEKRIETITAWYTPEISVNHGPDTFWGLPGLILEVSNGSRVMVCNKIVLNPKDEIAIETPKKGKKVSAEEYETIMREQAEKMNKMYSGGKKKGQNGNSVRIRING